MRFNRRRGGTVFNIVIGGFILFLVVSAIYYFWRSQVAPIAGTSTSVTSSSSTSSTSWSFLTSTTTSSTRLANVSLADLRNLSFANATKCDGLHDRAFWDTAMTTSGNVTSNLLKNTIYGLGNETNGWTALFRNSSAPAWMSFGLRNYTDAFVATIAAKIMGTDITQAAGVVKNVTSYAGGLSATALDFVFLGALSGEKVQLTTHNSTLAVAATFPGQLYHLYQLSFDCSYSEKERAQFFGTALTMTALLVATSGKDGFGPKFEALLTKLGLRDVWRGIKGYLKDINEASPAAAYETTMTLTALAKKFPANFKDLGLFTSSRIAIMVQVLKEKGLSADEIAQKVAELTKAVGKSDDENHVAEVADKISYEYEGFLWVTVGGDRTPTLVYPQGGHRITASFLASILPGFKVGDVSALKVTVHKSLYELPSYHVYQGGKYVAFALPEEQVHPGDSVGLSFELLPVEDFIASVPGITLVNSAHLNWVADGATLKDFKVVDGALEFRVLQSNPWSSVGEYTIKGEIVNYPGISKLGGIYAEFAIRDYAGETTDFRIWYDGFSFNQAGLQIVQADGRPVSLVSYDGFRLKFVHDSDNHVATIYIEPPSESIYSVGELHPYSGSYLKLLQGKYTNAWQIDNVVILRDLEKAMLDDGGAYALGRIGSEISYVAADKDLGLKNIVIVDPSQGGRDLYTQDNTVAVQARFLKNFGPDKVTTIQHQLFDLAEKLQQDYENQPKMHDGYAILSYLDTDGTVKTIILEVPRW